jgi:hypothetical protein
VRSPTLAKRGPALAALIQKQTHPAKATDIVALRLANTLRSDCAMNDAHPFCWRHSLQKTFVLPLNRKSQFDDNTAMFRSK